MKRSMTLKAGQAIVSFSSTPETAPQGAKIIRCNSGSVLDIAELAGADH